MSTSHSSHPPHYTSPPSCWYLPHPRPPYILYLHPISPVHALSSYCLNYPPSSPTSGASVAVDTVLQYNRYRYACTAVTVSLCHPVNAVYELIHYRIIDKIVYTKLVVINLNIRYDLSN